MKNLFNITQDNFKIFYTVMGEVVENNDPLKRDRVQVRILGITGDEVADSDCPWCEQKGAIFSGSNEISGISTVPDIGSLVYIEFLYGNVEAPMYSGFVRGGVDSSIAHDLRETHPTVQTRKDNAIGPELPELTSSSVYPENNTIETTGGNLIELDDTGGNERISIEHNSGSYFEIRPDGAVVVKSSNGDMYKLVKGNFESFVTGNSNEVIEGAETQTILGTSTKNVTGTVIVTGATINLN